jgi:predicted SAM-dependent methyltransferase
VSKQLLKAGLKRAGLYEPASAAWIRLEPRLIRVTRGLTGKNERLIAAYLEGEREPRLHIGAGNNDLPGWLNTELCPRGSEVFLDATRPFPFAADTFAFIYTEHMIEHIPYEGAMSMMRECFRVLRPGGVVRIVTPNMAFLHSLLAAPLTPEQAAYIRYSYEAHRIGGPAGSAIHVVNNFVRSWGHQFIYDLETLSALVTNAGLTGVVASPLLQSAHAAFQGLAKTDRMPEGFLEMESIVVEARKPA